uniref:RNA polymerase alpha subunit n=1 Tax=Cephaleuros karstenii TaxID=1985640 RepID=UPI001EE0D2F7|nr:RNA polymerase alpha subunit [Cephaleuros karstenii]UIB39064.1 RNA polymerase alpha subunit [Cephaleuros karstenii]
MIAVSCLDSKNLNNNNWYGRFQLMPFKKGEGLTIANALRRTLLTEKSQFLISWVDLYNAEIPYSILTGMRESIFDILLNLKQIVFTSDHFISSLPSKNTQGSALSASYRAEPGGEPQIKNITKTELSNLKRSGLREKKSVGELSGKARGRAPKTKTIINNLWHFSRSFFFHNFFPQGLLLQIDHKFSNGRVKPELAFRSNLKNKSQLKTVSLKSLILSGQKENFPLKRNGRQLSPFFLGGKTEKEESLLVGEILKKKNNFKTRNSKLNNTNINFNLGYICVKGPAIITARNIKFPKGFKCINPEKYILTLSDDGIFYLRFAIKSYNQNFFFLPHFPISSFSFTNDSYKSESKIGHFNNTYSLTKTSSLFLS